MADLTIRLNDEFTTTTLEDGYYDLFKNYEIDRIGVLINPINLKTQMALSFELPFKYKSLVKKVSSFEGSLCEITKKYTLKINGEMKVKLRSGVVERLNEEDGGYAFKLVCITFDNGDGRTDRVALDGQEHYDSYEAILTNCPTVTDFSFS